MTAKILELKSIAVLTIMMFFAMNVSFVYAEMPTEDPLKSAENAETVEKEETMNKSEDEKKESLDKAKKERGYGPLSSLDLYMDVINTVEGLLNGNRFSDHLQMMKDKYAKAIKKEIDLKIKKEIAEQARKKQTETLLREEFEKQQKSWEETIEKRKKDGKKETGLIKAYNWFKSSKGNSGKQQQQPQQNGDAGTGK